MQTLDPTGWDPIAMVDDDCTAVGKEVCVDAEKERKDGKRVQVVVEAEAASVALDTKILDPREQQMSGADCPSSVDQHCDHLSLCFHACPLVRFLAGGDETVAEQKSAQIDSRPDSFGPACSTYFAPDCAYLLCLVVAAVVAVVANDATGLAAGGKQDKTKKMKSWLVGRLWKGKM